MQTAQSIAIYCSLNSNRAFSAFMLWTASLHTCTNVDLSSMRLVSCNISYHVISLSFWITLAHFCSLLSSVFTQRSSRLKLVSSALDCAPTSLNSTLNSAKFLFLLIGNRLLLFDIFLYSLLMCFRLLFYFCRLIFAIVSKDL